MKYLLAITILFSFGFHVSAQDDMMIKKKKCYEKDSTRNKRFVDWQCGKIAGVIDCNEKLEYDEGSKVLFSASSGKPFTGRCETCHQNGVLEHRITFVEGKENGPDTTYYPSGCIMVVRNHVIGKENGLWTYYNDSTQSIAWEMNYLNGEKHGPQVFISPKGDTTLYENYKNGVLNGIKKTYYKKTKAEIAANPEKSLLEKEVNYVNGLFQGAFTVYNREGKKLQTVNYKAGKKDGISTYYYDDGVLLRTENWSLDAKNGEFKTFYYQQTLQSLENYKKNSKNVKEQKMDAEVYECKNQETANSVFQMLQEGMTSKQITDKLNRGLEVSVRLIVNQFDAAQTPYLIDRNIQKGVNKPYQHEGKDYVVKLNGMTTVIPVELKDGWFEERFPDQKLKRRALYKNNVLIEDHVYNEQGKETYTFGASSSKGAEDDAMPATKDEKKKKEPKAKKEKKKKGE